MIKIPPRHLSSKTDASCPHGVVLKIVLGSYLGRWRSYHTRGLFISLSVLFPALSVRRLWLNSARSDLHTNLSCVYNPQLKLLLFYPISHPCPKLHKLGEGLGRASKWGLKFSIGIASKPWRMSLMGRNFNFCPHPTPSPLKQRTWKTLPMLQRPLFNNLYSVIACQTFSELAYDCCCIVTIKTFPMYRVYLWENMVKYCFGDCVLYKWMQWVIWMAFETQLITSL